MPLDINLLELVTFFVMVAGAAIWLKSTLAKQRHEELEELADTRGHRIQDLEKQVINLQEKVTHLEGRFQALQDLKVEAIANHVVEKLKAEGLTS